MGYHGRVDLAIGFAWLASERQLRLDLLDGDILEPRDDGTEDREGARHRGRFRLGAHAKSQGVDWGVFKHHEQSQGLRKVQSLFRKEISSVFLPLRAALREPR